MIRTRRPFWLLLALAGCAGGSCGDGASCLPHDSIYCLDDAAYWQDSCGEIDELVEFCDCGCLPDHSGCRPCDCEPHATTACHEGDVWWFDSCGMLEELAARCEAGCSNGRCIGCTPDCAGRECGPDGCGGSCGACGQGLVCQTSTGRCVTDCTPDCGGLECGDDGCGGSCGSCTGGAVCEEGHCTCASHAARGCHEGDVWWFDSCGAPEEKIGDCPSGCADGQCTGCTPQCEGRECGPDPLCGQSCGTCPDGHTCSDEGRCVCQPDCSGLDCGPDPVCGQSCGSCDEHSVCDHGSCETICDLDPLESDTQINIDLPVVRISGSVSLNGAQMPDAPSRRGYVVLVNKSTHDSMYASVGESGVARYEIEVFAGTYDIRFHGYDDDYQQVVPYQQVVLQRNAELLTDRVIDLDLQTVRVTGTLTLNGQTMPDAASRRGYVVLADKESGGAMYTSVGDSGPARYELVVFAGRYDIRFHGYDDDYQDVVPYQQVLLLQDQEIRFDRLFDLDLQTVRVTGTLTLNGQTMPDATSRRGYAVLANRQTGETMYASVGDSGPARYELVVFAGRYDIHFHGYDDDYQQVVPYQQVLLLEDQEIRIDRLFNLDLQTARVSGTLTLNGQTMPDASSRRGYVVLTDARTHDTLYASVGDSGPAHYELAVFAGRYDVAFHGYDDDYQDVVPYQQTRLQQDLEIGIDRALDFDLQTISVSGTLTLNGARMPDAASRRGYVVLTDKQTYDTVYASVGDSGPAHYEVTVFAGLYDIAFHGYDDDYQQVVPYQQTRLQKDMQLVIDRLLDYDLHTIAVSGAVTRNGTRMPDAASRRGYVVLVDKQTHDSVFADIGATGPGQYAMGVFAGRYDVEFHGYDDDYQDVLPYENIRVRTGCLAAGACQGSLDDASGTWDVDFLNTAWSPNGQMTLFLVQDGESLSGTYTSPQWYIGSGQITDGWIRDREISFHVRFVQTGDVALSGALLGPCTVFGFADVSGGLDSDFVGVRR